MSTPAHASTGAVIRVAPQPVGAIQESLPGPVLVSLYRDGRVV